jgi:hypothetical protein
VAILSLYLEDVSSTLGEDNFIVTAVSMKSGIGFHYLQEPYTRFWWESQEESDHKENLHVIDDSSKKDLGEIGWDGMDWIYLAQDRDNWRALVNIVITLWIPYNVGKLLSSLATIRFLRTPGLHGVS